MSNKMSDDEAARELSEYLRSLPPDLVQQALENARAVSRDWKELSPSEIVSVLRRRFAMTQRQLALLAGLPHSKIARIEGGQDVQLSTLHRVFAGLGCGLLILPSSPLNAERLWRRTHSLWEDGHIPRRRRYPRR